MRKYGKIGFIGLGVMGFPMAKNLLKAGYELGVCDLFEEKVQMLKEYKNNAVTAYNSPAALAEDVDTVILMLPNTPNVEEAINGENGLLKGNILPNLFIIDMSSIAPGPTKKIGSDLEKLGIKFIDAPVSGGQSGAIEGKLTIMVGGSDELFEDAKPVLEAMGKTIIHCGDVGAGQTVKVVNQLMSAVNLIGMAEGFTMGVKAGVSPEIMREVINNGSGRCWAVDNRMPVIMEGNFEPGFTIDLHKKDLSLGVDLAKELEVPSYVTSLAFEIFKTAQSIGKGKKDNSAIINVYEQLAGVEVRSKK